jgi:sugar lactone lactonase YvrE
MSRLFPILCLFTFLLVAALAGPCPGLVTEEAELLPIVVASDSAVFRLTPPVPGVMSIWAEKPGKRELEKLWGPQWVASGVFRLTLPGRNFGERKGFVELFSNHFIPENAIGRGGRGERQFINPSGICWDTAAGELYVADTGNDRIIRLSGLGVFIAQYGGFGIAFGDASEEREDSLDEPWDVAVGGFSNLFVADQNNNRICEFDAYKSFRGSFFPQKEDRKNRLSRPRGLTIDSENNLWIVDSRADRVLKVSAGGTKLFELGGFGRGSFQFKEPTQVAIDGYGQIYVCDRGNRRIQVFDRLGSYIREIRDHLKSPMGVGVSREGLIYVCDESTGEVGEYLPNGRRIQALTGFAPKDDFRAPTDLEITDQFLIVADSGNHRVTIFRREKRGYKWSWQGASPVLE